MTAPQEEGEATERLLVEVPANLKRALKAKLALRGLTLKEWLLAQILRELAPREEKGEKR